MKTSKRTAGRRLAPVTLLGRLLDCTRDPNMKYALEVVKMAEHENALEELAIFLNYFSSAKRLAALTGNSPTTLQVLEMITPVRRHAP